MKRWKLCTLLTCTLATAACDAPDPGVAQEEGDPGLKAQAERWTQETVELGKAAWESGKEAGAAAVDATKEAYETGKREGSALYDEAVEESKAVYDATKDKTFEVYEDAVDEAKTAYDATRDKSIELYDEAVEESQALYEQAKDKTIETYEATIGDPAPAAGAQAVQPEPTAEPVPEGQIRL